MSLYFAVIGVNVVMNRKSYLVQGLLILASIFLSPTIHALGVEPMVSEIKPSGSGSSLSMTIRNDDPIPMSVEIIPYHLEVTENGKGCWW